MLLTEARGRFLTRRAEHEPGFSQEISNLEYREIHKGTLMAAGGFTPSNAAQVGNAEHSDLGAFSRWFISNPDQETQLTSATFQNAIVNGLLRSIIRYREEVARGIPLVGPPAPTTAERPPPQGRLPCNLTT